jgi:16S rRNA (cytidine1402-2'-O)-methyltransferase
MSIQKSYQSTQPTLYLVPTPIGNMQDMTYRAVEVLQQADVIYAEDTRVTKVLLSHFHITTPLKTYHMHNEEEAALAILLELQEGKNVALVSDAGTPGISDPGYFITRKALDEEFQVISLPGANAALVALVASGIPSEKFFFYGFLAHRVGQKEKQLMELCDFRETIIFYESPHRLKETIEIMFEVFGNRQIVVARELTKKYEEYIRTTLEQLVEMDIELRGEFVLVVRGAEQSRLQLELLSKSIQEHYEYYRNLGTTSKEAMKMVSKDRGLSKSEVYKELL